MPPTVVDREDYSHPENIYKDLIFAHEDNEPEICEGLISRFNILSSDPDPKEQELCWLCGWTVYNEVHSSYGSRIRIFHTRANVGIWEVGSRWMISDRPNDATLGNDFITQEFLRNQKYLRIPLIKEMQKLNAPTDKVDLTLMSRAPGVPLSTIWYDLTSEQKSLYRNQVGDAIKQMRQFRSPVPQKVDGGVLDDTIFECQRLRPPACKQIGRSKDEWFENLKEGLCFGLQDIYMTQDPLIIEEKYQELKSNFPNPEPYILTHGDLNLSNIIVKDDKIEAIIDWEWSGYFPWWAERWISAICYDPATCELFGPLWRDIGSQIDGGMNSEDFQREIIDKIAPALIAWNRYIFYTEHKDSQTSWIRPGFCKCQPYYGEFRWNDIGNLPNHKLRPDVKRHWLKSIEK